MSEIKERLEQLSPLQRAAFAMKEMKSRLDQLELQRNEPMALVGMGCRFPGGANCPESYWQLLRDGVDAVGEVPADRWDVDAFYNPDPQVPGKMNSKYGGFVKDVDQFDNHFFGIPDEEARMLDPQQRLLLEITWEALEDAGIPPESLRGTRTGVFLGISASEYGLLMSRNPNLMCPYFSTGTALSIAANRISFSFDWHGPSMAIDTACSSSLVAMHLAAQAIRNGECDTAIVGGSSLILTPSGTIVLTKFGLSASDGRIRAFDKSASGYVRSEGVGVVVLKSKQEAEAGGMRTYAFVRGSAVSQTGRANGLSAPVGAVQESTMRAACQQAGVEPGRLAYVETQGTGTLMGDAIEAKALGEVLVKERPPGPSCPIGSVKTNLGHLEAASGIASLMKVALCLKHGELPPTLHFNSPNPMIPFGPLRLRVPTKRERLAESEEAIVASVNAFGYGGSTAHVVLEASTDECHNNASRLQASEGLPESRLLPISARTESALRDLAAAYRDYLNRDAAESDWADICAMATRGREHHDCRLAIIAESVSDAARQIDGYLQADQNCQTPLHGRRPHGRQATKTAVSQALSELDGSPDEVTALAKLYLAGGHEELCARSDGRFTRVPLPHYPWQRQRLWIDESNPYQAGAEFLGLFEASQPSSDEAVGPRERPDLNAPYVAPQTELQSRIADTWSAVLGVEPVGIHDNFFELGGQSLQAAMLINELQSIAQIQLDPIALYESQTVHDLAAHLEQQPDDAGPAATSSPGNSGSSDLIAAVSRTGPLPLSFGQERFWFMDQLLPVASVYNTHLTVPLHGPLDRDLLQNAITQTISRHESLRTVIHTKDGEPRQQILDSPAFDLAMIDLSDLSDEPRDIEIRRLASEQAGTAFRLDEFPLFRMKLLRLAENDHVLLLTIHHIIVDGVSLAILLRDLLEFYQAEVETRVARLPELPVQYADYAVWQRSTLQGETLENNLLYWRQNLAGTQPITLPFDRLRGSAVSPCPGTHKFTIPSDLMERLQAVCGRQHVTPFMLLLTAFKTLLFRYSSQPDIVVGVPVAGRGRAEVADVVGFFVNTLLIRTDLPENPTFSDLLRQVRDTYFEGLAHQDMPFDQLVNEIEPQREPNRPPVFQVLFNYLQQVDLPRQSDLSTSSGSLSIGKIPTEQPPHGGELDLVLTLAGSGNTLDAIFGYNAALFDHATIEAAGQHLLRLLEGVADGEEQPLSKLPLLSIAETHKLSVFWNDTATSFSADHCLHELVEAQVKRTPHKTAVSGDTELTFEQLNRRANQVAHLLRDRGVGREELVGVCLPRSVDAIVSMLGILKAGAAFVPIDSSLPLGRIEAMLADSQTRRVITKLAYTDHFKVETICVGEITWTDSNLADHDLDRVTTPDDLAYCIFTSGSTGRPKGVLIEHRSVVNVVESFIGSYALGHEDRILQNTSLSFDVSINEIFPALCSGATIVISNEDAQVDAVRLARLIAEQDITIAAATPTVLTHLNREAASIGSLRLVLSGGEALSYANIDCLLKSAVVTNGYGPTETCIAATCYELNAAMRQDRIPIGRPLANYRIYVVDRDLQLVPPGCSGELCIAGVGLARGYAADPQLTAEKFVPCPFESGERMYRTGDLARWWSDGNLEFLGRLDRQIKLRGLRIELGEIESAIQVISEVEAAVVLNQTAETGDPRLVAYIVPAVESAAAVRRKMQLIADCRLDGLSTYEMPNGLELVHQNDGETEFLYRESFEHDCHLSHGIQVFDGCCVFDLGANIGVFALHVAEKCRSAKIHAFEPIPSIHSKLQLNAQLHGLSLKAHSCGIADRNGDADFVYFPDSGAMSGSFADPSGLQQRIADVQSAVEEHVTRATGEPGLAATPRKVEYETIRCPVRTISDVIRAERVDSIDLLKIDIEHG